MTSYTLIKYTTAEDVLYQYFNIDRENLFNGDFYGHDKDGDTNSYLVTEVLEYIHKVGLWGFADTDCNIHYWIDWNIVEEEIFIDFLAMEIAQNSLLVIEFPSDTTKEIFVGMCGWIAREAYTLMKGNDI